MADKDRDQDIIEIKNTVKDIKRILQLLTIAMYGGSNMVMVSPSALNDTDKLELTRLVNYK